MNAETFLIRLESRYQIPENGPKRDDIKNYLKRISPTHLDKLFDSFIETYTYSKPPRLADIAKAGKEIGIYPGRGSSNILWFVCSECGVAYSFRSRGCPQCNAMTPRTATSSDKLPAGVERLQEDCFQCARYKPGKTFGCSCEFYGADAIGKTMTAQDRQYCTNCECRECCTEARILATDENEFRRRMQAQHMGKTPDIMGNLLKHRRAAGKNTRQEKTA